MSSPNKSRARDLSRMAFLACLSLAWFQHPSAMAQTAFSDDFDRASLGANWQVESGAFDVASDQLRQNSGQKFINARLLYDGGTTTSANQYSKLQVTSLASHTWGFMLRVGGPASDHYQVHLPNGASEWRWERHDPNFVGRIDDCVGDGPALAGDWVGVTVEGAGTDTVVQVWRWFVDPDFGGPVDVVTNWGAADCVMTADPAMPVNGNTGLGVRAYTGHLSASATADNWFGGDVSASVCGDSIVEGLETCDDGNVVNGDGCDSSCVMEVCGNGVVQINEECDDGNLVNGDGCDAMCLDEPLPPVRHFTDNFDRASLGMDWSTESGAFSVLGNQLQQNSGHKFVNARLRYVANDTASINQYSKLQIATLASHTWGFMLRVNGASSNHYQVHLPTGSDEWRWEQHDPDFVELIDQCVGDVSASVNDWIGATVEGTGSNTVVQAWRWDNDPDFGGPVDIAGNWGLSDCTMTADPTTPIDSGVGLGVRAYTGHKTTLASIDNWHGGDRPMPSICGDGVIGGNEECDDAGESATCDADCTLVICGDGTLNLLAEVCDTDADCSPGQLCASDCGSCDALGVCGDGILQEGSPLPPGQDWLSVTLAENVGVSARILGVDIDGDGDTDFTADGNSEDHIYLWENESIGSSIDFQLTVVDGSYPGNGRPGFSAAGDIDGDGNIDVVAGGGGAVQWYEAPTWTRHPIEIGGTTGGNGGLVIDVDGDGHLDLISARLNTDLVWWRNPGPIGVQNPWTRYTIDAGGAAAGFNHDLALGDIDGDGQDELVALFVGGGVLWYDIPADPLVDPWPATQILNNTLDPFVGLAVGDLDDDGDVDVVISNKWYERPADPSTPDWTPRTIFPSAVQNITIADINADGRLDVIGAEGFVFPNGRVLWAEGPVDPKSQTWTQRTIAANLDGPENVWAGDLNGDGSIDVVSGAMGTSTGWDDNDSTLLLFENYINSGNEECDDGGTLPGDGCDENCIFELCGNGVVQINEECDDGNLVNGDGCDAMCLDEPLPPQRHFTDDFNRGSLGMDWSVESGAFGILANQLQQNSGQKFVNARLRYVANDTASINQYSKLQIATLASHTWGFMLRVNGPSSNHYQVHLPTGSDQWRWEQHDPDFVERVDQCVGDAAVSANDWIGATVEGTGSNTVVQVWRWDGDPDFGGSVDIAGNWGLPDCTMTVDPTAPIDSGVGLGIRAYTGNKTTNASIDNWYGGDLPVPSVCGDGLIEGIEECDDSNLIDGDGCDSSCILEVCGNGVLQIGEQCDDGNMMGGDGCDANCMNEPISGQAFQDDFNRVTLGSDWTSQNISFSISMDQLASDSGALFQNGRLRWTADQTDTSDQYGKLQVVNQQSQTWGFLFRGNLLDGDHYQVHIPNGGSEWRWERHDPGFVRRIGQCAIGGATNDGEWIGATIDGSGDDTVVRVWRWLADPDLGGAVNIDGNWGPPNCIMTENPLSPVNTGTTLGLRSYTGSSTATALADNWFGGDCGPLVTQSSCGANMTGAPRVLEIFNSFGAGAPNSLLDPDGVAFDSLGNVYTAACGLGPDSEGVFMRDSMGVITEVISDQGDLLGNPMSCPVGLTVDPSDSLFTVGFLSDNAFKRTSGGVITEIIDSSGDGIGNTLDGTLGIALDAAGAVFVTGFYSDNVFRVNTNGTVDQIIDFTGDGINGLDGPFGVAVDGSGNVYVAGFISDNIFRITPGGV
ncbi:MAG: DUF4215 domain-containing protein, partial [Acidobacteriota bacterium]|nr:DUF4215 domain-containing protein [Acidobacteriota bacterium]